MVCLFCCGIRDAARDRILTKAYRHNIIMIENIKKTIIKELVSLYIKINKLVSKYVIIISFHKQRYQL